MSDCRTIRVTEVVRQRGQLWISLGYTYVGAEYNHDDELLLDEAEARILLAELSQALECPAATDTKGNRMSEHHVFAVETLPAIHITGPTSVNADQVGIPVTFYVSLAVWDSDYPTDSLAELLASDLRTALRLARGRETA